MALTAGALSQVSVSAVGDVLQSAVATMGTSPYTYQWYRSQTSGFTPGGGNIISGATSLDLTDSGLTPGSVYYYKVVVTDSNATPATSTSAQLAVTTLAAQPSQNQFTEAPYLGMTDLKFNGDTIEAQFDSAGTGTLVGGQAVKFSTTVNGVPQVVPCTAAADVCAGFVNYNIKNSLFVPGDNLEISMRGNVMYLYAALAVNRGQEVTSLPAGVAGGCNGGVIPSVPSGGIPKVGFALDTAVIGALFRVFVTTPAYIVS